MLNNSAWRTIRKTLIKVEILKLAICSKKLFHYDDRWHPLKALILASDYTEKGQTLYIANSLILSLVKLNKWNDHCIAQLAT